MEDLFAKYGPGEISGVVVHNDEAAIGAASAIKDAGRQDRLGFVIGVDGTEPGLEAIADGSTTATVLQRSAEQGVEAIDVMLASLAGTAPDARYDLPFTLVTKEEQTSQTPAEVGRAPRGAASPPPVAPAARPPHPARVRRRPAGSAFAGGRASGGGCELREDALGGRERRVDVLVRVRRVGVPSARRGSRARPRAASARRTARRSRSRRAGGRGTCASPSWRTR